MKDIHWKLSAKKGQLMVKDRESISQSQCVVLVQTTSDRELMEQILASFYAVATESMNRQESVSLVWWNGRQKLLDWAYRLAM